MRQPRWPAERPAAEAASGALVPLAEVAPEAMEWLWPGRVPMGKVTLLAGEGGVGKSLLALDIAARASAGTGWPEEGVSGFEFRVPSLASGAAASPSGTGDSEREALNSPGNAVLMTPEDDLGGTIRPRLDAAWADVARVGEVRVAAPTQLLARRTFALAQNLAAVRHTVGMLGEVRLVVVGPLEAFVGRRARGAGLSWAAVRRAKRRAGVVHYPMGWQVRWMWSLPGGREAAASGAIARNTEQHWVTPPPDAANGPIRN